MPLRFSQALLTIAVLCFGASPVQAAEGSPPLAAEVDKLFASLDKTDSPGCALAIVKDGQIVYSSTVMITKRKSPRFMTSRWPGTS